MRENDGSWLRPTCEMVPTASPAQCPMRWNKRCSRTFATSSCPAQAAVEAADSLRGRVSAWWKGRPNSRAAHSTAMPGPLGVKKPAVWIWLMRVEELAAAGSEWSQRRADQSRPWPRDSMRISHRLAERVEQRSPPTDWRDRVGERRQFPVFRTAVDVSALLDVRSSSPVKEDESTLLEVMGR